MREACQNYRRPEGVLGGTCLNCGRSQPEHARIFGNPICGKCGHRHPGGEENCAKDEPLPKFEDNRLEVYRDIFNEITAKAVPFLSDPKDPERIISYVIPCGPLHRAAGKLGQQMFNGEAYINAAIARIAELEMELSILKASR